MSTPLCNSLCVVPFSFSKPNPTLQMAAILQTCYSYLRKYTNISAEKTVSVNRKEATNEFRPELNMVNCWCIYAAAFGCVARFYWFVEPNHPQLFLETNICGCGCGCGCNYLFLLTTKRMKVRRLFHKHNRERDVVTVRERL